MSLRVVAASRELSKKLYYWAKGLTWQGHEFIDAIKNETVWNKVKGEAGKRGVDLSFETIKAIATGVVKSLLNLP